MQVHQSPNSRAPLLSWDFFCSGYNTVLQDASKYKESVAGIKRIAKTNKWSQEQTLEAINNLSRYVIIITDPSQTISFTGKGFYEMTGYTFEQARGKNPNFLQGPATNKQHKEIIREQLGSNAPTEIILENYRQNGELYLCKILIKPVININKKLVNYIAYEQEIAA